MLVAKLPKSNRHRNKVDYCSQKTYLQKIFDRIFSSLMYTFYSQFSTRTDWKSVAKRAGCSKKPLFFALRISFIQWGINETITKLSWKFKENRTSGRFYFFKQKKEHKIWNPLYTFCHFVVFWHARLRYNACLYSAFVRILLCRAIASWFIWLTSSPAWRWPGIRAPRRTSALRSSGSTELSRFAITGNLEMSSAGKDISSLNWQSNKRPFWMEKNAAIETSSLSLHWFMIHEQTRQRKLKEQEDETQGKKMKKKKKEKEIARQKTIMSKLDEMHQPHGSKEGKCRT